MMFTEEKHNTKNCTASDFNFEHSNETVKLFEEWNEEGYDLICLDNLNLPTNVTAAHMNGGVDDWKNSFISFRI